MFCNQVWSFILVSDVFFITKHPSELLRVVFFYYYFNLNQGGGKWYDLGVIFTFLYLNFSFAMGCEPSPPPL